MSHVTRLAALAAILPLAALALASPARGPDAPHAHFERMLQTMDANGDGRISLDEYLAAAGTRFQSIDTQNKGSVGPSDLAGSRAAAERSERHAQALVRRLDSAGNGYVTLDEFVIGAENRFARLDRDHDGRLTPAEFAGRSRHHHGSAPGAGDHPRSGHFAEPRFERLDANHDGAVVLEEYVAAARALYAELDARHDGKVTADEIAASPRAQARAERGAERLVERLDANGDGLVSRDEVLAAAKTRFARLDRNGDGFIDAGDARAGRHGR